MINYMSISSLSSFIWGLHKQFMEHNMKENSPVKKKLFRKWCKKPISEQIRTLHNEHKKERIKTLS